jgi:pimeloyl-ACP methyl ester carboxylesterase
MKIGSRMTASHLQATAAPRVWHRALTVAFTLAALGASARLTAQDAPARPWADPAPHRVRHVTVAPGVQLEVLDWGGTGPALVFLAGLGNTGHVFDDFAARFRDRFHVYAITRRGFGTSADPADGYDAATRARDIVTVLDSLRIDRAALAGHSVAGDELSKIGATYPARVRALVYLDAYDYGLARIAALMTNPPPLAVIPRMTATDSASPAAVRAFFRPTMGGLLPEAEVRAQAVFGPDGRLTANGPGANAMPKIMRATESSDFRHIAAPALGLFAISDGPAALYGADRYARLDTAARAQADRAFAASTTWAKEGRDRFRAELAHGTVVELRGATHYVFLSHPDRVEQEMRAFLTTAR